MKLKFSFPEFCWHVSFQVARGRLKGNFIVHNFASNITFLPTSDHFWLEPLFSSFSFQFPYGTCYIHFSVKISWYYFIWREINSEKFDEADLLIRLSIFSGALNLFLLFLLLSRFNLKPQSTHKNHRIEEDEEMV